MDKRVKLLATVLLSLALVSSVFVGFGVLKPEEKSFFDKVSDSSEEKSSISEIDSLNSNNGLNLNLPGGDSNFYGSGSTVQLTNNPASSAGLPSSGSSADSSSNVPAVPDPSPLALNSSVSPSTILSLPEDRFNSSSFDISFVADEESNGTYNLSSATLLIWTYLGNLILSSEQNVSGISNSTEWNYSFSSEGNYAWNVKTCDAGGNCNPAPSNNTIIIDSTSPSVSITSPSNNSILSDSHTTVYYSVSDALSGIFLCWYSLNGEANVTLSNCENITGMTWPDGANTIKIWANDSSGNVGSSTVNFTVDSVSPSVSILSPLNQTYSSVQTILSFSASGSPSNCWYSTDMGLTNSSPNNCLSNFTGLSSVEGQNIWTVYAEDTAGNVGSSSVYFVQSTPSSLDVALISPSNNTYSRETDWSFSADVTGNKQLSNATLYVWNSAGNFIAKSSSIPLSGTSDTAEIAYSLPGENAYIWNIKSCDTSGICTFAPKNYTINVRDGAIVHFSRQISQGSDDAGQQDTTVSTTGTQVFSGYNLLNYYRKGFRFQDVQVPKNAIIINASISFQSDSEGGTGKSTDIYGEAKDNPPTFSNSPNNITLRLKTAAKVDYDNPTTVRGRTSTPDLASIVSEITKRSGWSSGNSMDFLFVEDPASRVLSATTTYEASPAGAPVLDIYYFVPDATDPKWRNQGTNISNNIVSPGGSISLSAEGYDETGLHSAWLSTNESGTWKNYTYDVIIWEDHDFWAGLAPGAPHYDYNYTYKAVTDTLINNGMAQTLGVVPSSDQNEVLPNDGQMVNYLNSIKGNPKVEIALHGYTHADNEFQNINLAQTIAKLQAGVPIIQNTLGITPKTFIPPNGVYNSSALSAYSQEGFNRFSTYGYDDPDAYQYYPDSLLHVPISVEFMNWSSGLDTPAMYNAQYLEEACRASLDANGICNFVLHFQNFANYHGTVAMNQTEYNILLDVINWAKSQPNIEFKTVEQTTYFDIHDTPMDMGDVGSTWETSSFPWQNNSVPGGTVVGWKIYYTDAAGNVNSTNIKTFVVGADTTSPSVSASSPANNSAFLTPSLNFSASVSDNYAISNASLYLDGALNKTDSSGANNANYLFSVQSIKDGNHTWKVEACDTSGNCADSQTLSFAVDTIPPSAAAVSPANNTNFLNSTVVFNVLASDNYRLSNVSLYLDGILKQTNSSGKNNTNYAFTITGITDGVHTWSSTACDWMGLCTSSKNNIFTLGTNAPAVSISYPTNNANLSDSHASITYTVSHPVVGISSCWYSSDNGLTNNTLPGCTNITGVIWPEGANAVIIWANDTVGNKGSSTVSFNVDTIAPQWTTLPSNATITYPASWNGVKFTASDVHLSGYSVNNPRFTINSSGYLSASGVLGAGVYVFDVMASDTFGNSAKVPYQIVVNKAAPSLSLSVNNATYPSYGRINASASNSVGNNMVYNLYIDGVLQTTGSSIVNYGKSLSAGNHEIVYSTSGGANFTSGSVTKTIAISKNNENLPLFFNVSQVTYPSTFRVYSTATSPSSIYRNGTLISNNSVQSLGTGTYNFSVARADIQNYTNTFNSTIFTVNKNSGSCSVIFNSTSTQNYPYTFRVYSDCNSAFTLYRNGTIISNNSIQHPGAGYYNFTVYRTDTKDYTNTRSTQFFRINKGTPAASLTNNKAWTRAWDGTSSLIGISELNAGDSDVNYVLWKNNTAVNSPDSESFGFYVYKINTTGGANWTARENIDTHALYIYNNINPIITIPQTDIGISVEATSSSGAPIDYVLPAAKDIFNASVPVTCTPVSGSVFAIGKSNVTCSATDSYGNTGYASFTVTVTNPSGLPVITIPESDIGLSVEATSSSGASVTYALPTAKDIFGNNVPVTCSPDSGSAFPMGTSNVACSATDIYGHTGTASFSLEVTNPTTTPIITIPPEDSGIKVTATSSSGAVIDYSLPTAKDAFNAPVPVTCTPSSGSTFPVGDNTIGCSATDSYGNTGRASFTITVTPLCTTVCNYGVCHTYCA